MKATEHVKVEKIGCRLHQLHIAEGDKHLSADNARRGWHPIVEVSHGALEP